MTKNIEHSSLITVMERAAFAVRAIFLCTGCVRIEYECGCFLVVRNFSRHFLLRHIAGTKLPSPLPLTIITDSGPIVSSSDKLCGNLRNK